MSAGKGSKDTRTPDYKKRSEAWDRIFGSKNEETPLPLLEGEFGQIPLKTHSGRIYDKELLDKIKKDDTD